jgi:acetylglutamate/LysW-gamma-L-alpha-aminoadipate kinase
MIVVKVGGRVMAKALENIVESIAINKHEGILLVHGGGDQVTEFSKKMGIEPKFVTSPEGIRSRFTDWDELQVYVMVMGLINKQIVSSLLKKGVNALGMSGIDLGIVKANRKKRIIIIDEKGKKRVIDGGYTGKISRVESQIIFKLISLGYALIFSSIAIDEEEFVPLNVDGDSMALAIASAIKANYLIFLTDVDGVILNGGVVKRIKLNEVEDIYKKIGPGMNRKIIMASNAISNGVGRVIIGSGLVKDPIGKALSGEGTEIVASS